MTPETQDAIAKIQTIMAALYKGPTVQASPEQYAILSQAWDTIKLAVSHEAELTALCERQKAEIEALKVQTVSPPQP